MYFAPSLPAVLDSGIQIVREVVVRLNEYDLTVRADAGDHVEIERLSRPSSRRSAAARAEAATSPPSLIHDPQALRRDRARREAHRLAEVREVGRGVVVAVRVHDGDRLVRGPYRATADRRPAGDRSGSSPVRAERARLLRCRRFAAKSVRARRDIGAHLARHCMRPLPSGAKQSRRTGFIVQERNLAGLRPGRDRRRTAAPRPAAARDGLILWNERLARSNRSSMRRA